MLVTQKETDWSKWRNALVPRKDGEHHEDNLYVSHNPNTVTHKLLYGARHAGTEVHVETQTRKNDSIKKLLSREQPSESLQHTEPLKITDSMQ